MISLYSTGCPKCKVLKKKLEILKQPYTLIEDLTEVEKFAAEHDLHAAPFLVLEDNTILDFAAANGYIGSLQRHS